MEKCKICGNRDTRTRITEKGNGVTKYYTKCATDGCCIGPGRDYMLEADAAWNELMRQTPEPEHAVEKAERVPFHMCTTDAALYVLCNDGAVYVRAMHEAMNCDWDLLPPVPGTAADMARDKG